MFRYRVVLIGVTLVANIGAGAHAARASDCSTKETIATVSDLVVKDIYEAIARPAFGLGPNEPLPTENMPPEWQQLHDGITVKIDAIRTENVDEQTKALSCVAALTATVKFPGVMARSLGTDTKNIGPVPISYKIEHTDDGDLYVTLLSD